MRRIFKKFEETHTVENKTGRGKKRKISNMLERKLVREVSKDPRTSAKTLVNDLAQTGIDVSVKDGQYALHMQEWTDPHTVPEHFTPRSDHPRWDPVRARHGKSGRNPVLSTAAQLQTLDSSGSRSAGEFEVNHPVASRSLLCALACVCVCARAGGKTEREIKRPRMAQASQDQGAVGVADPDDDSPNMIAYRKKQTNTQSGVMAWKSLFWKKMSPQSFSLAVTHVVMADCALLHTVVVDVVSWYAPHLSFVLV
ncbi:unnamed protein product [Leuciscus chuanchicus]